MAVEGTVKNTRKSCAKRLIGSNTATRFGPGWCIGARGKVAVVDTYKGPEKASLKIMDHEDAKTSRSARALTVEKSNSQALWINFQNVFENL